MMILASKWIEFFLSPSAERERFLSETYSKAGGERIKLITQILRKFIDVFGDKYVFITRCPGRINLRGMHVDTHGGFLNLMTIQQEVILVGHIREDDKYHIHNIEPEHKPFLASFRELHDKYPLDASWKDICNFGKNHFDDSRHWHKYISGVILRFAKQINKPLTMGLDAVVGGDIPEGSALSSSHALCLTLLHALMYQNHFDFEITTQLKMVQDAEWFTGARSGLSDQTAELLGKKDTLLGIRLHPETAKILEMNYHPFPEDLSIVVANSGTKRDISSTHASSYIKNRFAYSVAMSLLREIMKSQGIDEKVVESFQTLADFSPENLGGVKQLYTLFRMIPDVLPVDVLFNDFNIPALRETFERYYGHLPKEEHPKVVPIRGPLIFGICESIRAKQFFEALQQGDFSLAGYLMTLGHNGDRVIDTAGDAYRREVTNDMLFVYEDLQIAPYSLTGDFGASTPILDKLVDIANQNGALGSCLTGAGLGGVIVSLCMKEDAPIIRKALEEWLCSEEYARLVNRQSPLNREEAGKMVWLHHSMQGANLIPAPNLSPVH